jgi:hypothetical protein
MTCSDGEQPFNFSIRHSQPPSTLGCKFLHDASWKREQHISAFSLFLLGENEQIAMIKSRAGLLWSGIAAHDLAFKMEQLS